MLQFFLDHSVLLVLCSVLAVSLVVLAYNLLGGGRLVELHVHSLLSDRYFCGYPLDEVDERRLLPKLEVYLGREICDSAAALTMLAFRPNRTSRIVSTVMSDDQPASCYRAWVEFRFFGRWYAFDPGLAEESLMPLSEHAFATTSPTHTYSYHEFWSLPAPGQFYEKMSSPETSYLLCELFDFGGNNGDSLQLAADAGREFRTLWLVGDRPVSAEIVGHFMRTLRYCAPSQDAVLRALRTGRAYHAHIPE